MQELDFSLFQPLNGSQPFKIMSVHPTTPFIALQTYPGVRDFNNPLHSKCNLRCAIWHQETHEIVNEPEGAVAMAWNAEGNEIGLIREHYHGLNADRDAPIFSYTWERFSWPAQEFIHSCELDFDTNWPEIVAFSPVGDLAVIQWFEVDKSGLDFIGLTKYGDGLLDTTDLPSPEREVASSEDDEDQRFHVETNLTTAPVFSPDGRAIVFCWQSRQRWWTDVPDDVYVEGYLQARVGECHAGYVQIINWETRATCRIALFVNLPPGWQPSYEGDRSNELLNEPAFIDDQHFQVQLPSGETQSYSILE